MKGLELPINMIIIIAIAVLVLVVIAAFFTGYFTGGTGTISLEAAFSKGCAALRAGYGCSPDYITSVKLPEYKAYIGDTIDYDLGKICIKKGITTDSGISQAEGKTACARACGCLVTPTI